jgi:poly-gamma-glutamate synthesis protein (capsule biosynthesis protein)
MLIFLSAGLVILAGVPLSGLSLKADIPPSLLAAWQTVIREVPLPAGVSVTFHAAGAGDTDVVTMRKVNGTIGSSPSQSFNWKTVERVIRAPVARIGDRKESVSSKELNAGSFRIRRLEDIELPETALAVDGLLPGDAGYALAEEVQLGVSTHDPSLHQWFDAIPEAARSPVVLIGAVGDVMPARGVDAVLLSPRGIQTVFGDTLAVLRHCDYLLGNLEAAATRGGKRVEKAYNFRFDPNALDALKNAGFAYFSITNNHSIDYGREGFLDTLSALSRYGIGTSGAGADKTEAWRPFTAAVKGVELNVLSFGDYPPEAGGFKDRDEAEATADRPGILWLDDDSADEAGHTFSRDAFTIVMVHGGVEWTDKPTAEQKSHYRRLIEAGADLVIGSHPHYLQGLEAFKGGLIAYSLGNFLFPGMQETGGGDSSVILQVGVYKGKIRFVHEVPVRLSGATVRMDATGIPRQRILSLTEALNARP